MDDSMLSFLFFLFLYCITSENRKATCKWHLSFFVQEKEGFRLSEIAHFRMRLLLFFMFGTPCPALDLCFCRGLCVLLTADGIGFVHRKRKLIAKNHHSVKLGFFISTFATGAYLFIKILLFSVASMMDLIKFVHIARPVFGTRNVVTTRYVWDSRQEL